MGRQRNTTCCLTWRWGSGEKEKNKEKNLSVANIFRRFFSFSERHLGGINCSAPCVSGWLGGVCGVGRSKKSPLQGCAGSPQGNSFFLPGIVCRLADVLRSNTSSKRVFSAVRRERKTGKVQYKIFDKSQGRSNYFFLLKKKLLFRPFPLRSE